jgi:alpha-glucosidase
MNQTRNSQRVWMLSVIIPCVLTGIVTAKSYSIRSPAGRVELRVNVDQDLTYSVFYTSQPILHGCPLSLTLGQGMVLGSSPEVLDVKRRSIDKMLHPVVRVKSATIRDQFQEMTLKMKGSYALVFRAYDDAIAYRWITDLDRDIEVVSERVAYHFLGDHQCYFPKEDSFMTHSERNYEYRSLSTISAEAFCSLPALVEFKGGPLVVITESDLSDYAGLYLKGTGGSVLTGIFPTVALEERQQGDRNVHVSKRADYMARTRGKRAFPWRVVIMTAQATDLIENQTVYKLAPPLKLKDTSWIKPGKVAWDWYNYTNIYGVDFRAGVNTETYKYYIDFAAQYGLEYIILDEGWYPLGDLLKTVPEMDVDALFDYAEQKGVGIILWVVWKTLEDQLQPALDRFAEWGAAGIKVDFMQRDDQWMVNYYERIAREAARRHLLVDFHGSYSPKGLRRAYPNVITREGVRGLENNKWTDEITPEHNVTLPFIRMLAGPMDYTPGAMVNAQKANFNAVFNRPMSLGTRCHQMAMYVVYESPLQMLADNPSHYLREPECMAFLAQVPSVWDETRALMAQVADYVVVARRSGDIWYIGAMTDWSPRELTVALSFLGPGTYAMDILQDGINADRYASDFKQVTAKLHRDDSITLKLAPGGGWVGRAVRVADR